MQNPLGAREAYFQQQVATTIDVRLDDVHHLLRGSISINYTNHSADTLPFLYFHLWPNAYQHDHTLFAEQQYAHGNRAFYYASPAQRGFIDSLQFIADGRDAQIFPTTEQTPDVVRLELPVPLPPGGSVLITTPFRVKIPNAYSRFGHNGQAYFISQWFPKPAVYDRNGWNPLPYLDQGEFYSEFGSYDVSITLPANYVVMATGNLMTEREAQWLDSLAKSPTDTSVTTSILPKSSQHLKTIRFTEDHVHDFAWFADKRWLVDKETWRPQPAADSPSAKTSNAAVTIYTAFLPQDAPRWRKAIQYLKNTLAYYGDRLGAYPYRTIKAVEGDVSVAGGMEYPTVTLIDRDEMDLAAVVTHEAGHNWFYGILASNERANAWMDEGGNTFFEHQQLKAYAKTADARKKLEEAERETANLLYQLQVTHEDQPLTESAEKFLPLNYGLDVYAKEAFLLNWLQAYLGADSFGAAMRHYYSDWRFRHPEPTDFFQTLALHSNRSIAWFQEQHQSARPVDFALRVRAQTHDSLTVQLRNNSLLPAPAGVGLYAKDSLLATAWTLPYDRVTSVRLPTRKGWTHVRLLPAIPDARPQNNEWSRRGFPHQGGLRLRPFLGYNDRPQYSVFAAPAISFNVYDGLSPGLLIHNLTMPQHRLQFATAAVFGLRSLAWTGAASLGYTWFPSGAFQKIIASLTLRTANMSETGAYNDRQLLFARYVSASPTLEVYLRRPEPRTPLTRKLTLNAYRIQEDAFDYQLDPQDSLYKPGLKDNINYYGRLRYQHTNDRPFNPFSYEGDFQLGEAFAKINIVGKLRIDYHRPRKAMHVRAFIGKYFDRTGDVLRGSRYYLNSTFTGANDYLYDDAYIGRNEQTGLGARQVAIREGGLKIATPYYANPLGRSDDWLVSLQVKTDLPIKLPIRLFADAATFARASELNPSGEKILYDAGLEVFVGQVLSVYLPFVMSKDFNDYSRSFHSNGRLQGAISFSINLGPLSVQELPNRLLHRFRD